MQTHNHSRRKTSEETTCRTKRNGHKIISFLLSGTRGEKGHEWDRDAVCQRKYMIKEGITRECDDR